jgi:hypothetical protein
MSNRGGGDASLTARIQILNEGLENLQKTMQQLQQLRVEFQNTDNQMKSFEATRKTVGSGNDAIASFVASATGARNQLGALNSTMAQSSATLRTFGRDTTQGAQGAMQLKSSLDQVTTSSKNLNTSMQASGAGITSSIAAYSAAAVSVFGLYNAYDNLEKVQQRADRTALAAQTAQTRLASLQENYNEQLAKHNLTAEEVAVQQQKIADATERVTVANEAADIAAGDLNESMAGLALQTLPFVATAGINVIHMITTMRAAYAAHTVQTGVLTTATVGLRGALTGLLFHPAFLPLVAIGGIVTAFVTNLFGLRDAINGIGVAIGNAIPGLRPLLDLMGGINSLFGKTTDEVKTDTTEMSKSFTTLESDVAGSVGNINSSVGSIKTNLGKGFDDALNKVKEVMDSIDEHLGNVTIDITPNIDKTQLENMKKQAEGLFGEGIGIKVYVPEAGRVVSEVDTIGSAIDRLGDKANTGADLVGILNKAFDSNTATKLVGSINSAGNAMYDFDGNIRITTGQLEQIRKTAELSDEDFLKLTQTLKGFVSIDANNLIPMGGMMVDADLKAKLLEGTIGTLKTQFGSVVASMVGLVPAGNSLTTTLTNIE